MPEQVLYTSYSNNLSRVQSFHAVPLITQLLHWRDCKVFFCDKILVRAMCGAQLMEKKRTEDLMEMLGLKESVVQMTKTNGA